MVAPHLETEQQLASSNYSAGLPPLSALGAKRRNGSVEDRSHFGSRASWAVRARYRIRAVTDILHFHFTYAKGQFSQWQL